MVRHQQRGRGFNRGRGRGRGRGGRNATPTVVKKESDVGPLTIPTLRWQGSSQLGDSLVVQISSKSTSQTFTIHPEIRAESSETDVFKVEAGVVTTADKKWAITPTQDVSSFMRNAKDSRKDQRKKVIRTLIYQQLTKEGLLKENGGVVLYPKGAVRLQQLELSKAALADAESKNEDWPDIPDQYKQYMEVYNKFPYVFYMQEPTLKEELAILDRDIALSSDEQFLKAAYEAYPLPENPVKGGAFGTTDQRLLSGFENLEIHEVANKLAQFLVESGSSKEEKSGDE